MPREAGQADEFALSRRSIVIVQGVLANNAKDADAAMGTTPAMCATPAMRHVRRQSLGY